MHYGLAINHNPMDSHGPIQDSDELGEIVVTDKRILLILAMDGYAVKRWGSPGEETARETAKVVYRQWC